MRRREPLRNHVRALRAAGLEALEPQLVARGWARIQALGGQPRPPGREIKDATRIIDIVAVRHRRDAHR